MKIKIFEPIESMNPIYLGSFGDELYREILSEHNGRTCAEIKEDGYRMQVHKKGTAIRAFTRSMNEIILELFPDIMPSLQALPDCIIDCELSGYGKIGHDGFNAVKKRFRHKISNIESYLNSGIVQEQGLGLTVFDTLYWVDRQVIGLPLTERRKITEGIQERKIVPSRQHIITDPNELGNLFEDLAKRNYEGLVCKNPGSLYVPGAKTKDWIKVKRAETMDLVILGVYYEQGAIGQLLCGTYNDVKQQFETLARVNAKREGYNAEIAQLLEGKLRKAPVKTEMRPGLDQPDYFVNPLESVVVEVAAMNIQRTRNVHSCGLSEDGKSYSLRIAWLKDIRYDKKPLQSTTTKNVETMYAKQVNEGG